MKTAPKLKAKKSSPPSNAVTKKRRVSAKSTSKPNGKHPLVSYEHAPIGIVESSLEGKHLNVNEEFCRITGYDKTELLQGGIKDFTDEEDYPIDVKLHGQLVEGKIPFYKLEKRYVRKDGGVVWVELTRSLVRDAEGKPLYTIGVVLDISERKHVERVLRDSSERLRLATETAQMFMWEWDFEHQTYTLPDNFTQVLGFSTSLSPKNSVETIQRFVPAEDLQSVRDAFTKAFENQKDLHSLPCRVINPENGQIVWLEVSAKIIYDHAGKPERMFGVAQNITESRQREEALGESEELFRALVSQATAGIAQSDLNGRFTFVNPKLCEMLGYSESELIGKTIWELTYADDLEENKRLFERMIAQGQSYQFEKRFIRWDGSLLWVNVSVSPIRDLTGKPKGGVGVLVDINERKRMENEIQFISKLPAENPNPLIRLTPEGQILYANKPGVSLLEFWQQQIQRTIPEELQTHVVEAFASGLKREIEIKKNGKTFSCTLVPVGEAGYVNFYGNDITERKRAEQALQEKDQQLRHITDVTPVLFSQCSSDLRYLFVNRTAAEFLGFAPEEIAGKPIRQIMGDKAFETVRAYIERVLQGERVEYEMEIPYRGAGPRFMHVIYVPEKNDKGEIVGWIATVTDMTERKRMEQALAESARQQETLYQLADQMNRTNSLEDIFNAALDAILSAVECDRASILLFDDTDVMRFVAWRGLSDRYRKFTEGHSPWKSDEKNPKPVVIDDIDIAELSDSLKAVVKEEGIGSLAFIPLVSNGKLIGKFMAYFNAPHIFSEGEVDLSLTIARQLAFGIDRKRAVEKLRESEERYRAVVESQSEMLCRFRPDGTILFVNGAYARARDTTPEALLNHNFWEFITEEDRPAVNAMLDSLTPEAPEVHIENRFQTTDGERWTLWTNRALRFDSNGHLLEVQSSGIDITERKQAEKRLALLGGISELIREFEDPIELLFAVSQAVGEHLQVKRCLFNEIDLENDHETVHRDYCRGVESVAGVHKISDYSSITTAEMVAGKMVVNCDSKTDARTAQDYERSYMPHDERAYVAVPLMRENEWVASLWISDDMPRQWSKEEVSLLETVAERTWAAIESLRVDAALRASEALYRAIARSIPGGGVYVVDKDFRYLVAEGMVTEAFGLARESIEGYTVSEVFTGEVKEKLEKRLTKAFAGEMTSSETVRNGRVYWSQYAPLVDSIGQAIVVTQDITERKQMEEALRRSEERFARFMQYLPGLAWIKDLQGRYVYANAAAEKAFNTPREELYGKTDYEVFPAEVADQFKKNDERALLDGKDVQMVETLKQDDGVLHYSLVSKFPIPGPDGKPALIGGTAFDITERLQAEEALRESEERFSAILRQATAGIVRKDAQGRFVYVNQAFCNMLGYTEADLIGKTVWEFMHEDDIAENKRSFDRLMMEGVPFNLERRFLRAEGSLIWVDASVSPIMDAEGKPQSAVAVEVDITGRKQAEESLQQLNLQLESRVETRTAELRATNKALQENRRRLQILSQRLVDVQEEERRALARELHDRVGQTLAALNINLIIIEGQLTTNVAPQISARLNDSMKLVAQTIALVRDVMTDLRPAVLDDYGLEAALESHLEQFKSRYEINAKLERPAHPIPRLGPSIEMTFLRIAQEALMNIARHAQASEVKLSLRQEQDVITMTVQDNGIGIESWQEANRPGSHGLTIMRERAEAFGGTLQVRSAPGQGTQVDVSIPIQGQKEAQE